MRLVRAIAETYSPLLGRKLTPETDVCVSVGASEGSFPMNQNFIFIIIYDYHYHSSFIIH
jgi:aspartate/methionine/tyrosine aminotransferase